MNFTLHLLPMKRPITIIDHEKGDTRTIARFAWLPTVAGGFKVWLRWYYVLQVFRVEKFPATIEGKEFEVTKKYWDSIEKRI